DAAAFSADFADAVASSIPMETFGLAFQPVKALGLGASGGATDFGGLFVGLSQFVIVSAALLVALLFGLAMEQRASEIGSRLALGFPPSKVRRRLLAQGGVLAAVGGLVGLLGAVAYARLMMLGLATWWRPAVGTSRLELHVGPTALVSGYLASMAVVLLTILLAVRKAGRTPVPQLLRGVFSQAPDAARAGRRSKLTAAIALGVALLTLLFAVVTGRTDEPMIFFAVGPALLVGLLAFFAVWIDRPQTGALERPGLGSRARMAVVNSRRNRNRSLLSTTLVAFATFLIVTVAAFHSDFADGELGLDSGAGGYALVAEADIPLQQDLGDAEGRFELGVTDSAEELLAGASVMPFRLLPGDDTSCLNLYQPGQPRVLGVPRAQIERGGFVFAQMVEERENPWELLEMELEPGVIPAIGDYNSTQWILKLPLGQDLVMENELGEEIRLRLVASLATSVFQSEMLISEARFLEHFPSRGGWPYFLLEMPEGLLETPENLADEVAQALERDLEPYGLDAVATGQKLAAFHAVQNTYLSTFRSLGALGLLLGTVGLAVVLLRNVLERRSELAALRAFGYRRRTLLGLVVAENGVLLLVGLGIGAVAALTTAGSHLI
ncbi:MAG: FtsX-like permease family protein, partial [Holophagales bacterium]|nr:FtsX-like permease family protein [Holophagales bacterium]